MPVYPVISAIPGLPQIVRMPPGEVAAGEVSSRDEGNADLSMTWPSLTTS